VTCSRYFKEDSLLTFFVLLTTWIVIRAVKQNRPRELLLAGFVAGLAASSKYSGALSCSAILLAPWLKSGSIIPDKRFFLWGCASAVFVPVGFILASPYVVLNYSKFHSHFIAEQEHMQTGHHKVIISSWSQYWMYHLSRSIIPAVTWPVFVFAMLGFGMLLRFAGINGLYVTAMFLAFYLPAEAVNAKPPPQPERYILPCIPFFILASAYSLDRLRVAGPKTVAIVLTFLLIAVPIYRSTGLALEMKNDTRILMRDWITQNVPKGSKIVVDAQAYSAFLPQSMFTIQPMWTIPQRRTMSYESFKAEGIDYLLLTNKSYERYFLTRSADQVIRMRFEDIFTKWVLAKDFKSDFGNYGFSNPELSLYKVELK
jgi:4-amino-4-deoxy-L-arabinose transferase-like glycosyltransferase